MRDRMSNAPENFDLAGQRYNFSAISQQISPIIAAAIDFVENGTFSVPQVTAHSSLPLTKPVAGALIKAAAWSLDLGRPIYEADGKNFKASAQYMELVDIIAKNVAAQIRKSSKTIHFEARAPEKAAGITP